VNRAIGQSLPLNTKTDLLLIHFSVESLSPIGYQQSVTTGDGDEVYHSYNQNFCLPGSHVVTYYSERSYCL